jgi:hypothetical protein
MAKTKCQFSLCYETTILVTLPELSDIYTTTSAKVTCSFIRRNSIRDSVIVLEQDSSKFHGFIYYERRDREERV